MSSYIPKSHKYPKKTKIRNPFGYSDGREPSFYSIFFADKLAEASHCTRKAFYFYRRGVNSYPSRRYKRINQNEENAATDVILQGYSIYNHTNLFRRIIFRILEGLKDNYFNLPLDNINSRPWIESFNDLVKDFGEKKLIKSLKLDLINFFTVWAEQDWLTVFRDPNSYIFYKVNVFNYECNPQSTQTTDPNRGIAEGTFPVIGSLDIIDFTSKRIFKIICHDDSWVTPKSSQLNGTVSEDSTERRYEIIWEPHLREIHILKVALESFDLKRFKGAIVPNEEEIVTYGGLPNILSEQISDPSSYFSSFDFIVSGVNQFYSLNTNIESSNYLSNSEIIDGLVSSRQAMYEVNKDFIKISPCYDVGRDKVIKDIHCDYFGECTKRSLRPIMPFVRREVKRIERLVYGERKYDESIHHYRIAEYLPDDPLSFVTHLQIWVGVIINTNPLQILLNTRIPEYGLEIGNEYNIPFWTPFFGPIHNDVLMSIERTDGNIILEFGKETKIPQNTPVVILSSPRDLIFLKMQEQEKIVSNLYVESNSGGELAKGDDIFDPNVREALENYVRSQGGRRTAQGMLGGSIRLV